MKKNLFVSFACLILVAFTFFACTKDDTKKDEGDLSEDIKNIVPDTTLQKIVKLGMVVNRGTTPPDLENIYKASPFVLKATNIPSDYSLGHTFSDYKVKLYDQDNVNLSIKLDYINGPESGTGIGGFISGSGNSFSIFVKVHSLSGGAPADVLQIISGTMTSTGISNFYFSNYMLDDYGDPNNYWIENGQGRVIYDSDGSSPIVNSINAIVKSSSLDISGVSGVVK